MQKSPYKFLDSYSKEDRDIFFGRDKEIEELYSRVFESRILIVYGISGTGKSSLINCGLANKFNDSDWLPVTVRRGTDINRSLFDNLDRISLTGFSSGKKAQAGGRMNDILKIIRSIYLDHFKPVYLIFDQFEEVFIFGNSKEREELIANVRKIINSDLQCRLIFSIREEYLAGLTEFEKTIPAFLTNRIRIEKMTRENAIRVVEGPCKINNIAVESGFPEMLLDRLNPDTPEVELTWLQVYLDKVFRLASRDGENVAGITKNLLDKAGDVKDLLGSFLEEQISQLDNPELGLVILKSFVSVKGTKHQITEEEVIDYSKTLGKDIDREILKGLIQKFIRLRILRDKDANDRYELRHDSLATRIYEKITIVEKELIEIRQFLENAFGNYEKRGLCLTEEDLAYVAPYEDRLFLNEKITKFISHSKRSILKTRRRRQNILISTAAILFVVLSFFSLWALKERSYAVKQKKLADQQRDSVLIAKVAADSARQEALLARNLAEEKENQAIMAQLQSEEAKKVALSEREYALQQKDKADNLSITASEQARIATREKIKADSARSKAVVAEGEARKLNYLSTAQNLALKSSGIEKDPQLMGLLAVQAFIFNKNNGGKPEDPIIYEALNEAYSILDNARHSVFTGSPNEIRILRENNDGSLLSADLDGQIRKWDPDGNSAELYTLPFNSPINYIGPNSSGDLILTQHDNLDLFLWDTDSPDAEKPDLQDLKAHNGFVRTAVFSGEGRQLATAGRDSSVIIWSYGAGAMTRINAIKIGSGIRAMVFFSKDSLILAQEDGTIILWDVRQSGGYTPVYSSETEIPLCLAWNQNKKVLIAGCSNGRLQVFKFINDKFALPDTRTVHDAGIDLITFNSDFSLMATSSWDKTIKFYNYHEFFEFENIIGGSVDLKNLNYRARSLIFTSENKLVAGMGDKSIRIWETSSGKIASLIRELLIRDMTVAEWNEIVGTEIPYEYTRRGAQ